MQYPQTLPPLKQPSLVARPYCILAACDDKYSFCLYVSLQTLLHNSPNLAQQSDIWIAGFHLSASSKQIFNSLPHTQVTDYEFPGELPLTPAIINFTPASFARYECFRLLTKYQKVIYLDSDILVQQELSGVFDQLTYGIGLVEDPNIDPVGRNFSSSIPGFNMNAKGFNSGFIVLHRQSPWYCQAEAITNFLYDTTLHFARHLVYPDQGVINLAIEKFQLHPTVLPESYNCPASRSSLQLKRAFIIHSTGPRKFWCYYYFDQFYKYYTQWIRIGGAPVSVRKEDSQLYTWLMLHTKLNKYVFIQLCPDFVKRPLKALRFLVKKLCRMKF